MPEGPSIVIARDAMKPYIGKTVGETFGISKQVDTKIFVGHLLKEVQSFGKELLLVFDKGLILGVHFMMFGSYRFDESKTTNPRLHLGFEDGSMIKFYTTSLKIYHGKANEHFDFSSDIMSKTWDAKGALKKLQTLPQYIMICDALLDQSIFAGLGNIIKNEVLFRCKVQPESLVAAIPTRKKNELIQDAVAYAQLFLKWKKAYTLKQHWEAHTKKICPRDGNKLIKKYTGKRKRRSFFCIVCQNMYE